MLENPGYAVLQILEFVHAKLMGPVCRMGIAGRMIRFLVLFYSVKVDGIRTLEMRNDRRA